MPTVHVDKAATLEETDGVITSLTRTFRVTGVTSNTDFERLVDALAESGVPAANSSPSGRANLKVVSRSVVQVGNDNTVFDVTVQYAVFGDAETDIWFSGSSTLQQISTENDNNGSQILLSHTFPDDDTDFGLNTDFNPSGTPKEVLQGGEINVFSPTATIQSTQLIRTNVPTNVALDWVGTVNSQSWGGSGERQWMCTDVTYTSLDIDTSPEKWKMTFEFQYKQEGWTPTAIFIDPRTGKPPQNLLDGVGIKDIFWHKERNFNTLFPT